MKTQLRPSQLLASGQIFAFGGMCQELMDTPAPASLGLSVPQTPSPGPGGAYSLCEVCNLQLTSDAQAQLHCNGRSHLRRVRQLRAGGTGQHAAAGAQPRSLPRATGLSSQPAGLTPTPGLGPGLSAPPSATAGSGCGVVGGALPGLIGATGPSVMMKPFLSYSVETTSPVGLFPNFNTMDPVQKAVINHTFGVTMVPKKKQVISCNVCQLRFNSDSQAEAHYRGSRHAKKLKSQENKSRARLSITAETNGSSSSCGPAGPAPHDAVNSSTNQHTEFLSILTDSSTPLKAFLLPASSSSSPPSSSSPSSSRAGSEPPPSSPPSALPAPGLSSPVSASSSSSSKASPPAPVTSSPTPAPLPPPSSQDAPLPAESEEEKAKKLLYCSLCKVAVNSLSQLEAHNAGSKHKTMLEARSGAGPIKAYPRPGAKLKNISGTGLKGSGLQNKTFHCQICDVHVNSEIQLKQHISSRRHKDRVAGKPSKPKYSPYNKPQRNALTELVKPSLSPSFLTTPFAPAPSSLASSISLPPSSLSSSPLLTATSSPLTTAISLHHRPPASPSLFTASFLRPAPGPMRASQASILFAPY
ncbi:zinc finger protein 385B isoform X1 [Scophthalmus maximus]|uniref:zinc finger protein 385B isoform X1 n=1 Tax=Scophthalmus maximus TaxID=52904 RepID=UPI001FA88A34|nr:zinc finger protein 385B isoform X1 [Scophthalmus maximus]XP_047193399.1 zinc finger protein 385B isoform X1 [Scophthalmus maximus]